MTDVTDVADVTEVTGVTDVADVTDITDVTDVTGVTDVTDVTDIIDMTAVTDITDVTDVTDVTGVTDVTDAAGQTLTEAGNANGTDLSTVSDRHTVAHSIRSRQQICSCTTFSIVPHRWLIMTPNRELPVVFDANQRTSGRL